jgi:acetolactate synthase-1/2/3 large subunit
MHEGEYSAQQTGGREIVDALLAHQTDHVFGLPGIQLDPVFDALYDAKDVNLVTARHEQGVSYMADGYARTSGKVGVGIVVPGPGFLNALAGLATAYTCGSRVLMIVGQIDSELIGLGRGALHEIPDQFGMIERISRWSTSVRNTSDLRPAIDAAFSHLESHGGPAIVEVPADILRETPAHAAPTSQPSQGADRAAGLSAPPSASEDSTADVREALDLLAEASSPVLVVGGGLRSEPARAAATGFIDRFQIPTVVTEDGKGVVPASHELVFERSAYGALRADADLILAVGTRFVNSEARPYEDGTVPCLVVNTDTQIEDRLGIDAHYVYADGGAFFRTAVAELEPVSPSGTLRQRLREARETVHQKERAIAPQIALLSQLRAALPQNTTLVADYTQLGYAASFTYPVDHFRQFIWPGFQGTLGYSFATGIGAAFGAEGLTVVVTGDGGFSWTLEELSTLAQYEPNLIVIIVNDGYYGNVRRIQQTVYGGREIASKLTNPDYQVLAQAFGIRYRLAEDSETFGTVLAAAAAQGGPCVVELKVGEFPAPWGLGF